MAAVLSLQPDALLPARGLAAGDAARCVWHSQMCTAGIALVDVASAGIALGRQSGLWAEFVHCGAVRGIPSGAEDCLAWTHGFTLPSPPRSCMPLGKQGVLDSILTTLCTQPLPTSLMAHCTVVLWTS